MFLFAITIQIVYVGSNRIYESQCFTFRRYTSTFKNSINKDKIFPEVYIKIIPTSLLEIMLLLQILF